MSKPKSRYIIQTPRLTELDIKVVNDGSLEPLPSFGIHSTCVKTDKAVLDAALDRIITSGVPPKKGSRSS